MKQLAVRLEELPIVRAIRQRYDFEPVSSVETEAAVDFCEARDYALSSQMLRRVAAQKRLDGGYAWFFELEDDAVLFALKFGHSRPRRFRGIV